LVIMFYPQLPDGLDFTLHQGSAGEHRCAGPGLTLFPITGPTFNSSERPGTGRPRSDSMPREAADS
jgi:hypothetical protein